MNKILVPVDGSAASQKAATKAAEIAKEKGSEILFLSVIEFTERYNQMDYLGESVNPQVAKILFENQTKMLESLTEILDLDGVKFENKVIEGIAYEEILKCAEDDVDLIVMSQRGFSKVKRFFMGSVTHRVISDAPCPVLVINADK
ncbi:MAG: universal stress protein [Peptostreptococcales bacterium]|jgi:nucleotide-binding universal stress UspA family protein